MTHQRVYLTVSLLLVAWTLACSGQSEQRQQQQQQPTQSSGQLSPSGQLQQPPALQQAASSSIQQANGGQGQSPADVQRQLELIRLRQTAASQQDGNLEELHHGHGVDGQPGDNRDLWPMVNVDRNDNKSKVDVHVPIFFDMSNQNDPQNGRAKLDLSVLHGLVTVSKDKARDQSGQMNGPVRVTVFGIPVYTSPGRSAAGNESRQTNNSSPAPSSRQDRAESVLESRLQTITDRFRENFERTNEKVMRSFSDIVDRLAAMLKRPALSRDTSDSSKSANSTTSASNRPT